MQKSVQAYQQTQQDTTFSEIPSRASWEEEPARNFAVDLKRLRAENLASQLNINNERSFSKWIGLQWAMHFQPACRSSKEG